AAWEALPGAGPDTSLLVVRGETAARAGWGLSAVVGLGLGVVLGLLGYRLRAWGRWRLLPLLAWLALAGLGVLFLPPALQSLAWGPLAAGALVGLLWYGAAAVVRRTPPARAAVAATAAVTCLLVALGAFGPAGRAA